MTWYWWKHWFWITVLLRASLTVCSPLSSVDTSFTAKFSNVDKMGVVHLKREPLTFPMSAQSDSEDVVGTQNMDSKELLKTRSEWFATAGNALNNNSTDKDSVLKEKQSVEIINKEISGVPNLTMASIMASDNQDHEDDSLKTLIIPPTQPSPKNITHLSASLTDDTTRLAAVEEENTNGTIITEVIPGLSLNNTADWSDNEDETTDLNETTESGTEGEILDETNSSVNRRMDLIPSERKSKILHSGYRDEVKILNNSLDLKNNVAAFAVQSEERSYQTAGSNSINYGLITSICLACFVGTSMIGTGLLLYRRRYINKPQVLGEPDSAGYIDDSTIRDNSDEMYSLDNDSFLNSLEAMTIQNYWTDSVKHTKL